MTDDDSAESVPIRQRIPWWKLANVLGVLLLIAIVVPFVVFAVPQAVGADHSYVVTSGSMEPSIPLGSVVIVKQAPTEQIEVNDVITFQTGEDQRTTHRVIDITEQDSQRAFQTKGDANEDPDQSLVVPGQTAELEGRVMTVGGHLVAIPFLGYVITFMNTQTGFVALVAIPFVLLIANEVWNVVASASTSPADGGDSSAAAEAETEAEAADVDAAATAEAESAEAETAGDDGAAEQAPPEAVEESVADGADSEGITLRATELRLSIVSVGGFLAYSAWVAYATTEFWSFAVAAGVGTAFALLVGLYISGKRGSGETEAAEAPEAAAEDQGESGDEDAAAETAGETSPESDTETEVLEPEDIALSRSSPEDADGAVESEPAGDPATSVNDAVSDGETATEEAAMDTDQGTTNSGEEQEQPGD